MHERDRKGSADTTQKIEIYFNFIVEYIPPTMEEKEPTPEEPNFFAPKRRIMSDNIQTNITGRLTPCLKWELLKKMVKRKEFERYITKNLEI